MHVRTFLLLLGAVASLSAAAFAFALPGAAACGAVGLMGFESLPDGTLVDASSSDEERRRYAEIRSGAAARIDSVFGASRAHPVVIFFKEAEGAGPLARNATGSTHFIGSRACVVLGPKGHNIDVVAHELMHAELFHRVGYLVKLTQIPTWFDEGVALQVDFRPAFALSRNPHMVGRTGYVRQLTSGRRFFSPESVRMVQNYVAAKAEVAGMLDRIRLYDRLDRLREGEDFDAVFEK